MSHIKEAMALAGMNPVVGMAGPHHGSFIVNVTNHDKDLGDDGKLMTGLSKSLDMDDNLYGIDDNGKFFAKKKYTVMERKDIVEAYGITKNCDDIYKLIEEELRIPYENRPVHGQNYIYELVTGHDLLTEDQMQYDTLLEKIDLEKMSNALGGVTQGNLEGAPGLKSKGNKQAGYIPDTDWPQGTENIGDPTLSLEGTTPKFTTRFSNKGGTQKLSMNLKSPDEKWNKKIKVRDTKNGHEESSEESFVSIQEDLQKLKEIGDSKFEVPLEEGFLKNVLYKVSNKYTQWSHKRFFPKGSTVGFGYEYDKPNKFVFSTDPTNGLYIFLKSKYPSKINQQDGRIIFDQDWYQERNSEARYFQLKVAIKYPDKSDFEIKILGLDAITDLFAIPWGLSKNGKTKFTQDPYLKIEESKESVSLEDGFMSLVGINESKCETKTIIPFNCEIKYCHNWIDNGQIKPIKGEPNPMLILHKDKKNWRVRTELLLFKDDKVFLCKQDKVNQYGNKYKIPGGGIDDPSESVEIGAARECEEEALIIPKNVRYSGVSIQKVYEVTPWWHPLILHPEGIKYDGSISFVCTGLYSKDFKGYVKKMHQDDTKNGHFYSWNEAKDILSPEHKKLFKEYLESRANFLESMEGIDEAFDLKVKLYHGSAEKYNVLKPVSYNDGNRLQSKAWSIFFWDDKELAKHWAVFVSMLSVYRDIRDKTGIKIGRPIGQHVKVGFNKYQYKIFVRKEDFDIYKQKLNGKTAYVYTAELPIYKIGIGNNSFQPEYTYNGRVTPSKTEPLKITTQLMAQYCTLISDEQYSKYKEDSSELTKPIRGFLNPLFNNNNGAIERWKHIYRKIHAGKAKPGDDLDTLLSDFPKEELLSLTEVGLDTVNESVWNAFGLKGGPHLTLYHGSPDKFDQIKPTSLTVGNSMHKPGWAVFMFDDKRLAMAYAMAITIQIKFADWFKENKIDAPIGWFENDTGFFKYKPVNIVDETNYEKILKKVIGTKFYIYTLQVPIDKDLNMIGTTNTIPEYTYTGIPKMVRCEEMTITKELFDAQYKQVSTTVFQMYKARKMAKKSLYGPWMKMFVNMDTRGTKRKLVLKTLKLEPGSDLSFLSTIIGKDDYHHDVGKWLEGKNKTLYVLGLSGSGKTTMTNNLSKLLNIPVIHIDEIHHRVSKENGGGNAWKAKMNKQARRDLVWNEVQKQAQKYDHRVIIDGGPMILHKVPDLEKQSYIIPGTSVITSTFRMIKRTLSNDTKQGLPAFQREYKGKSKIDMIKNMLKIIYSCASGNFKLNKEFQALKTHNE